ncbi:MAG: alkaline phosphatase D family protein [Calditrichota bacterium]
MLKTIFNRSRREFIRKTFLGAVGLSFWPGLKGLLAKTEVPTKSGQNAEVDFLWSGGITSDSAVVNAKMTEDSTIRLVVSADSNFTNPIYSAFADADENNNNRVVRLELNGLSANTTYYYAVEEAGNLITNKTGKFRTFPVGEATFSFALASCARSESDRKVFETIENKSPLFFLHMGDMHYEDIDDNDRDLYRSAYDEVHESSRQSSLYRNVPLVYMWDDHDYGHNNSHRDSPGREAAQLTYREYVPHYPLVEGDGNKPIYYTFDVGRVHFILTDMRSERVKRTEPDNAQKTMMGDVQKDWLKQQLLLSPNYALVVWVNTVPWIHEQADEQDHWGGYTTEREEIAQFIKQNNISNLVMVSGDAHMVAADDGTNNTYGGGVGFPVLHAACLDRPASEKGGPYSEGAYPGNGQFGLITITDNGPGDVMLRFVGQDEDDNEILTYEKSFNTPLGTSDDEQLPEGFILEQNYPNPFNGSSTIRFHLPEADQVRLELFDTQGRHVDTLINQRRSAGWHAAPVNSDDLASGSYFYRLITSKGSAVRKLMLIR